MRAQEEFGGVSMKDVLSVFEISEKVTGTSALAFYNLTSDKLNGCVELSSVFRAGDDQILYLKSLLPLPEEYQKVGNVTYVGKNQALLDAIYNEVDFSRSDEAVLEFYDNGWLDDFVKYARKAGLPEEDLIFGIQPAIDEGYELPEKEESK